MHVCLAHLCALRDCGYTQMFLRIRARACVCVCVWVVVHVCTATPCRCTGVLIIYFRKTTSCLQLKNNGTTLGKWAILLSREFVCKWAPSGRGLSLCGIVQQLMLNWPLPGGETLRKKKKKEKKSPIQSAQTKHRIDTSFCCVLWISFRRAHVFRTAEAWQNALKQSLLS